jgi:hypothetical protein
MNPVKGVGYLFSGFSENDIETTGHTFPDFATLAM